MSSPSTLACSRAHTRTHTYTHTFTCAQEPIIADVSKVQRMLEPLLSYHPFWLRLGLLIVTKDAAAATAAAAGRGSGGGTEAAMRRGMQVGFCHCLFLWQCSILGGRMGVCACVLVKCQQLSVCVPGCSACIGDLERQVRYMKV